MPTENAERRLTYFISDMHLGARYLPDMAGTERRVCDFLHSIKSTAKALYILGDALDYWYEYRNVVPRGYVRFFGALADLADSGVEITWLRGNHDIWLFDYLRNEIGMTVVDGYELLTIKGKHFFLSHGDGLGKLPPLFRAIRATFRCRFAQRLYAAIHPRWTVTFAHRWSSHSRDFAHYRPQFLGEQEPLIAYCREYLAEHPGAVDYFVFGHRHVLVDYPLGTPGGARMIILGDWIHHFSYGVFDGEKFSLHRFEEDGTTAGEGVSQ